jgi:hypothetical protein
MRPPWAGNYSESFKVRERLTAVIKGDIFDNLGIGHSQASDLRMRADLLDAILRVVKRHNLTQKQLARR